MTHTTAHTEATKVTVPRPVAPLPTRAKILAEGLDWLIAYWPDLRASRVRGTARPWRPADLTSEARAERDSLARLERAERAGLALAEVPSPVHEDVLDLLTDLLVDAEQLAAEMSRAASCPMIAPPSSGYADARPYLAHAAACLPAAVDERDTIWWAGALTWRNVDRVAGALALVYRGQRLAVVCPWCRGVTPETPAGGAHTWRIRNLPGDQVAIVCEGECEPPLRDVGTWYRGAPCWPMREWEWLARRIAIADAA